MCGKLNTNKTICILKLILYKTIRMKGIGHNNNEPDVSVLTIVNVVITANTKD